MTASTIYKTKNEYLFDVLLRKYHVLMVGGIIFLGLLIRVLLLQPPINSDDIQYFHFANSIFLGDSYANHISFRMVITQIIAFFQLLGGYGLTSFYSVVFFGALLNALSIYTFARILSGLNCALISLILWACSYTFIEVDTRILPDNLGTSFSLLGLSLVVYGIKTIRNMDVSYQPTVKIIMLFFFGGFLTWMAWSTRATFAVAGVAGALVILLHTRNLRWLVCFTLGGLLGLGVEFLYLDNFFDDPLIRFKTLLGYGQGVSGSKIFQGYTVGDMLYRYPRLIEGIHGELIVTYLGLLGLLFWVVKLKEGYNGAKLIAFCFLAFPVLFALASVDPLIPFMREKLRYSAVFFPFICVAASDAVVSIFRLVTLHVKYTYFRGGLILLTLGAIFYVSYANIIQASGKSTLIKNGNTSLFEVAKVIKSDQQIDDVEKTLCLDARTTRVMALLLPREEQWHYCKLEWRENVLDNSYLVLNWRRLNANLRYGHRTGAITKEHMFDIEKYPLLLRHRNGPYFTDVFKVSEKELSRSSINGERGGDYRWRVLNSHSEIIDEVIVGDSIDLKTGDQLVYEGSTSTVENSELLGRQILEVVFTGKSPQGSLVQGELYLWPQENSRPLNQYMGRVHLDKISSSVALWTYLPSEKYANFKIKLTNLGKQSELGQNVEIRLLSLVPGEKTEQFGGAW